ncbi:MAG TPA: F0F1 ATP synthase subunit epsilon [Candidatus Krumholzibacteria bacterium]|nr:F0F1 ATP synthase subunit epsilon [Candidatus Krumholzibacteria bacterium]
MEATFQFKMLTPTRTAFEGEVVSIVAPGGAGYLGILAHHAPIISTLKEGELKVRFQNSHTETYKIGRGLLKVAHNSAIVLTESVEDRDGE